MKRGHLSQTAALLCWFNCDSTLMSGWSWGRLDTSAECSRVTSRGLPPPLLYLSPSSFLSLTHTHVYTQTHTWTQWAPSNRRPESSRQTLTPHISLISSQHQTATLLLPGGLPVRPPHTVVSIVANAFLFSIVYVHAWSIPSAPSLFWPVCVDNELSWDCWAEFSNCCRCLGQVVFLR